MTKYYNPSVIQPIPIFAVQSLPAAQQTAYSWICSCINTGNHCSFQDLRKYCGIKTDKELRGAMQALKRRKLLKRISICEKLYTGDFEILIPESILYLKEENL